MISRIKWILIFNRCPCIFYFSFCSNICALLFCHDFNDTCYPFIFMCVIGLFHRKQNTLLYSVFCAETLNRIKFVFRMLWFSFHPQEMLCIEGTLWTRIISIHFIFVSMPTNLDYKRCFIIIIIQCIRARVCVRVYMCAFACVSYNVRFI